ncbi:MAG: iron-containing alcohol dehydrogenase, partial [Oscillospiraceae bacterium]
KAAFCAGRAFTRGSVGYVHAVGHALGGMYNCPHGQSMSILLPHVMRRYGSAAYCKLAELCDVCGIQSADDSQASKAEAFLTWIEQLKAKMNIPVYLPILEEKDIEQLAAWAYKEGHLLYPTPTVWSKQDFIEFLHVMKNKT